MHSQISSVSETKHRQLFESRILILHALFAFIVLLIIGRLIELQIVKGKEYAEQAENQQLGNVTLSAKRGEILSRNSKNDETSIFATNTTLDLLYIDPLAIPEEATQGDYATIGDELSRILISPDVDSHCRRGGSTCPSELVQYYRDAFNPMRNRIFTTVPTASGGFIVQSSTGSTIAGTGALIPGITEIQRQFARAIERKIEKRTVTFVPLLYGANKKQLLDTTSLRIPGVNVIEEQALIYANPDEVQQKSIVEIARTLSPILKTDPIVIQARLLQRPLRYVPIMGKLLPTTSKKIKDLKDAFAMKAKQKATEINANRKKGERVKVMDPFRSIALIPEHRRYYPDTTIASHVIGFINALAEPQYGIERTYDSLLRGQEVHISSLRDPLGGQIVSESQNFIDPRDGSTIVLTIDRFIQAKVEELLEAMLQKVDAESGQVIIMDPYTGRIIALANAPLFDSNEYASVYDKEPITFDSEQEKQIIAEVYNPENNDRILRAYLPDTTPEGRERLKNDKERCAEICQTGLKTIADLEKLYDINSISRYYYTVGGNARREIFPTRQRGVWLKFKNNIGVGSYVNRTIQEVYEPGSVMKPVTMAIAMDQQEVHPLDTYNDTGALKIDNKPIRNALGKYYGLVTMVECLDFSINTCMTFVSRKLGRQLLHASLEQFGFGQVTGIELDSELPGDLKPLAEWNTALVMTIAYGQGISATPLQMITAFSALANGGKLMKPTIIDEIRHSDGSVDKRVPEVVRQVIKPETANSVTGMLVHGTVYGFAKAGKVKGHRMAGKTGTSQIAGPGGRYETGTGSTVATYAGYAPIDHPRFVILVKLDRPKKDDFGSKSAAPLFRDIATFLFDYYGIPPDEK